MTYYWAQLPPLNKSVLREPHPIFISQQLLYIIINSVFGCSVHKSIPIENEQNGFGGADGWTMYFILGLMEVFDSWMWVLILCVRQFCAYNLIPPRCNALFRYRLCQFLMAA